MQMLSGTHTIPRRNDHVARGHPDLCASTNMSSFIRNDGVRLPVVEGFRDEVLAFHPGSSPRPDWSENDYDAAATRLIAQAERTLEEAAGYGARVSGARVLEVGCGSGLYSLALAARAGWTVVGVDLHLSLFARDEKGERVRRLALKVLKELGLGRDLEAALRKLPLELVTMDARHLSFAPASFDLVWSRVCLEHVVPVEQALDEMARVLTPDGLMYHRIDPFFWVRGCHRRGLVDIPWAHARLSPDEYRRFVRQTEGRGRAAKRTSFVQQLNRFTVARWRDVIGATALEIHGWEEEHPAWVVDLLERYPEVQSTAFNDVSRADLTCSMISTALRKSDHSRP
jgi:ubiquinone/menaquinone biosynthesis C-methylase UbiE